jgi:hypothetical protein
MKELRIGALNGPEEYTFGSIAARQGKASFAPANGCQLARPLPHSQPRQSVHE